MNHDIRYPVPAGTAGSAGGHSLLPLMTGVGIGLIFSWNSFFAKPTVMKLLGDQWGNFASGLIVSVFAIVIWPLVIRKFSQDEKTPEEASAAA